MNLTAVSKKDAQQSLFAGEIQALIVCPAGQNFFHWQNTGAALQVVTTHSTCPFFFSSFSVVGNFFIFNLLTTTIEFHLVILELRIFAMYGSKKSIGILCCFLTISEAIVYGCIFGIAKPGEVGQSISLSCQPERSSWLRFSTLQQRTTRHRVSSSVRMATHQICIGLRGIG